MLSLGINGSKGSASRKWTSPSGIATQGSLDVIVENATRLKGAVIASHSNDLQLSTRTLSTQDIALYDNDRQVSGSIGINTTINGPNGPKPSKPGFKINATYANKQIKGIARATISGGQIEVTSQTGKQTARQLASLNRNADKSLEITSVIDEGFELYLSDTSLQAAFKAGAKIRDVLEELLFRLGEKQLSKELGSKDLPLEHALAQLRENCHVSQQGFNILEFFVGTAYAAQGCVIETLSGKPVVIHDTDNCYWAVFSAILNGARALGKAKFRVGLQDGLIELGDEFVELAKDPGKVFDDLKGIVYALIKDPHGTAIKLGVTIADDIYTKALQYASALANEDYTKAGKLAAALTADLILKVALPVAGVTITAAKAASGFNKLTKKFTFDDKGPNGASGTNKGLPCCFVAGTPVKTTGGYKNIEELVVGDEVLSQNVETGAIGTNVVTDTHIRPISEIKTFYKLTIGSRDKSEELFVTGEHPFWVTDEQKWVTVDDIEIGAKLTNHQGHALTVQAKIRQTELQQTYNITVAGNNNYFAGRLETLVHNCGPKRSGTGMLGINGTQTASTTVWKGTGKNRIDVENPNPGQRPGQVHFQDNAGNKYLYDTGTGTFPGAPNSVNKLLKDPTFVKGIKKAFKYLGE